MRFSVCIPTYNRAAFLPKAIESVLSQSYTDFELVVLDNASTDETSNLLKKITDPRVRVFANETTISMYANHNLCVQKAQEDWIVFLHSDDELDKFALENISREISMSTSDIIFPLSHAQKQSGILENTVLNGPCGIPELLRVPSASPTGVAYKRSIFRTLKFDEDEFAADLLLLANALTESRKILLTGKPVVKIGIGDFQYTSEWRATGRQTLDISAVFGKILEVEKNRKALLESVRNWKGRELSTLLMLLSFSNNRDLIRDIERSLGGRTEHKMHRNYNHVRINMLFGHSLHLRFFLIRNMASRIIQRVKLSMSR